MNKVFKIYCFLYFLLLVPACNPIKRLQKSQADITRIVDAANNNTIIVKDSLVYAYLPGRKDSAFFSYKDTLNNVTTNEHFYYTHDTVKLTYYIQDAALITSARRTADIATGNLQALEKQVSQKAKDRNTLFFICLGEALIIGIITFLKFKL